MAYNLVKQGSASESYIPDGETLTLRTKYELGIERQKLKEAMQKKDLERDTNTDNTTYSIGEKRKTPSR